MQEDVGLGVLGGQQEQLGADRVGVLVAHLGAEEDDPLAEQPLVDVVVESGSRAAPFIWGFVVTWATLANETDTSTGKPALFASSGLALSPRYTHLHGAPN